MESTVKARAGATR